MGQNGGGDRDRDVDRVGMVASGVVRVVKDHRSPDVSTCICAIRPSRTASSQLMRDLSAAIDEKGENFAKGILCALSENDGTWTDVGRDATRVHCGWAHVMSTIPEEAAQLQGRRRSATRKYGSNQIRLPGKEEGFCVPYALQGMETNEAPLARAAVSVVCHHADRRLRVRGIHEAYFSNGVGQ